MSNSRGRRMRIARIVHWIARLTAVAAIVPVLLIFFGEPGSGPAGPRERIYLALFPFGFALGYLLAWRWPLTGGCLSLACMAASLVVIGRTYALGAYLIWGILCVPGILFVVVGWMMRHDHEGMQSSMHLSSQS